MHFSRTTLSLAAVLAVTVASSCTKATDTQEYRALQARFDKQVAESRTALKDAKNSKTDLQSQLDKTERELEKAQKATKAANDQIAALKKRYAPEIRAEAQKAWDTELQRACGAAAADLTAPVAGLVNYNKSAMEVIGTEAALVAAVEGCAAPQRAKTAEQRQAEKLASCTPVVPDQIQKDPDGTKGGCFVMYAYIQQFDTNTGKCSFQATIAAEQKEASYEYEVRVQLGYGDSPLLQQLSTDCPALAAIDQNDTIKVWATGIGPYSYTTTLGGTNSVPAFKIEKVELVTKG